MTSAEVTVMHTAKRPDENYIKDPRIIKVAKLALILADTDVDLEERICCANILVRMGYITEEECRQLLMYRTELEGFHSGE